MSEPRYAIGIDLGTTHCALSEVDLETSEGDTAVQRIVPIPQVVAPGNVDSKALLPSFVYLPHPEELPQDALRLPWMSQAPDFAVGEVARRLGEKSALRLVSSAKSWLCHTGVDRRAAILPHGSPDEVPKLSPLDASMRYLSHLKHAYEAQNPAAPLSDQDVVITIPASFDPVARELTAEAAREAGLADAVLLEEPQAALYSWLQSTQGGFREQLGAGDVILVVDVGGGTTDLSLIAVRDAEGTLALERIAVGEHILLGGDNMDLTLAYQVKQRLESEGKKVDPSQMTTLAQACRAAKERLLGHTEEESAPVVVAGRGSSLVGGSLRTELRREDVQKLLLDGFFPEVGADARPAVRARTGLTQLGLPYAQDPAITKHLAAFLDRQAGSLGDEARATPSAVLFNGGVFKGDALRKRVLDVINQWQHAAGHAPVRELEGADLDLAVARGAAYYAYVRRGGGIRIRGGSAMAYYVGVESAMPAVPGLAPPLQAICIAPFGMEEGTHAPAPEQLRLGLVVGHPVRFPFFGSSVRRADQAGDVLSSWSEEELFELNDIEVTLDASGRKPGEVVTVQLVASLTEAGTLVLEAVGPEGERWRVELETRDTQHA